MQYEIVLSTSKKQEIVDITAKINLIIKASKIKSGICNVFAAHATAAIIINENYDPNICLDLLDALNKLKLLLSSDIIFDIETEGKYLGRFNRKGEKV